jgi:hypothetical protein
MLVVSFTDRPFHPRKRVQYPMDIRLAGRASLDAVEKIKVTCPCRESYPDV